MDSFPIEPNECLSTHGGAGYAPGSYKDGDDIICGACGARIKNPPPTGWDAEGNPKYGDAVRSKDFLKIC